MDSEKVPDTRQDDSGSGRILGLIPMFLIFVVIILRMSWVLYKTTIGQKTRNTQQRRVYVPGSRQRQLSVQGEPTIFVSPANLPPPPKYEAMAPPSYEEVMGIHYPAYQQNQQPITQPLTLALAQGTSTSPAIVPVHTTSQSAPSNVTVNITNTVGTNAIPTVEAPAVVTVANEDRRTSVTVRA